MTDHSLAAELGLCLQQWWHNPDNVDLVQFMGKDNVPFHTVIFPATQLGTGQPWTLMKGISVTEYLTYEGAKFSKRNGVGVFGNDTRDTGIPVEVCMLSCCLIQLSLLQGSQQSEGAIYPAGDS